MARSSNTQAPPGSEDKGRGRKQGQNISSVREDDENDDRFDLGPWIEVNSTRVSQYRWDYMNHELQVQWANNKNHGYVYRGLEYSDFRGFAEAVSKGRRINTHLNGKDYELMTPDEVQAPSNTRRRAPKFALRGSGL